jgi:hypothetical protein
LKTFFIKVYEIKKGDAFTSPFLSALLIFI